MSKLYLVNVMSNFFAELDDSLLLRIFSEEYFLRFLFYLQCEYHRYSTLLILIYVISIFSSLA